MEETKEVTLANGKKHVYRGFTYWEYLKQNWDGDPADRQLEHFHTCLVEPQITKEELRELLKSPVDGRKVAQAIAELEGITKDFQESSLESKEHTGN